LIPGWLYLFSSVRTLHDENLMLRTRLAETETALAQTIGQPNAPSSELESHFDKFIDMNRDVFEETPFEGGKIPDSLWLTPEEKV